MPAPTRLSLVNFVPALADPPPTRNPGGAPEPRVADLVTVTSVPTPYRECRTVPCASLTPADAAVTVITRPIPTAIPKAMKLAWRLLRLSSRRRYVKNIRIPLPRVVSQHRLFGNARGASTRLRCPGPDRRRHVVRPGSAAGAEAALRKRHPAGFECFAEVPAAR